MILKEKQKKGKRENSPRTQNVFSLWRIVCICISEGVILAILALLIAQKLLSWSYVWLDGVNTFLFLLLLFDFLMIFRALYSNDQLRGAGILWFWAVIFILNIFWAWVPSEVFENQNLYPFHTWLNNIVILIGFLILGIFHEDAEKIVQRIIQIYEKIKKFSAYSFLSTQKKISEEQKKEKKREDSLVQHYTWLGNHHIILRVVSWFYRAGARHIFILVSLLLVGTILRIWNLGDLGYSTDEGSTAFYSLAINNTGLPCSDGICYLRGLPYLYFVSFFTDLFGVSEFWVRFPGVLLSMLSLAILYIFLRSITRSKNLALFVIFLLTFADWHFMLSRYARMYGMFALMVLLVLIFYYYTFYKNRKIYFPLLILTLILAIITHQFGLLLSFLIIDPLLTRRYYLYKKSLFILFIASTISIVVVGLTRLPGIIYLDTNFVSLYDIKPEYLVTDKYWYLQNLQLPNWRYIKLMFSELPLIALITSLYLFITVLFRKKDPIGFFSFFIIFAFIVLAIYRIDYQAKYLWWLLVFIYIPFSFALFEILQIKKAVGIFLLGIILISNASGILRVVNRDYGESTLGKPLLMNSGVEKYHPDDKTIVEYLASHYIEGDIIISDYWMHEVYIKILLDRKSDYSISRWNADDFLVKFPFYKLYDKGGGQWALSSNGQGVITSASDLRHILESNTNKRIWYLSSADFKNKKSFYISMEEIDEYISNLYSENLLYTGEDGISRVFLIHPHQNESSYLLEQGREL